MTQCKECGQHIYDCECDFGLDDADVPYEAKRYYCTICQQNEVNALDGYDTCEECLSRR